MNKKAAQSMPSLEKGAGLVCFLNSALWVRNRLINHLIGAAEQRRRRGKAAKETDDRERRSLRMRGQRPCHYAASNRDELASPHGLPHAKEQTLAHHRMGLRIAAEAHVTEQRRIARVRSALTNRILKFVI